MLTADIHIGHRLPSARAETDWYAAMARSLRFVRELCDELEVPCVIAGDLFHTWREPAETIAFAMRELPREVYAVPGQHDLPYHRYDLMARSAYGVLVQAGRIVNVEPGKPVELPYRGRVPVQLHGFPWGFPPSPLREPHSLILEVAVVHRYLWVSGKSHLGADEGLKLGRTLPSLAGYEVAVFGDNHLSFLRELEGLTILNCGALLRRTSDQRCYSPSIGVLYSDGSVRQVPVPSDKDRFVRVEELAKSVAKESDFAAVVDELRGLGDNSIRFGDEVSKLMEERKPPKAVREAVLGFLEKQP